MKLSRLVFAKNFQPLSALTKKTNVLIYDRFLEKTEANKFISRFDLRLPVEAGEDLKSLFAFEKTIESLLEMTVQAETRDFKLIAMGGGSIGDFAGFVASVFKRGIPLVHIPSTWLAAIDSAHGGKTALNVGRYKNQIGTFYPAETTYLVKDLLLAQPQIRAQEASAEALKMALIMGGPLWRNLSKEKVSADVLWKYLPALIQGKYKIVRKDPFEKKGPRALLNLGHTLGHVLEKNYQLSHGQAVLYGLRFALDFSTAKRYLSTRKRNIILAQDFSQTLPQSKEVFSLLRKVPDLKEKLLQDKKLTRKKIRFVFLKSPGRPFAKEVPVKDIVSFIERTPYV